MAESQETVDVNLERDGAHIATITTDATPDHERARLDTPGSSAKQKRRRTSPRDHAVLESAYQKNSKPDKEERLNLVKLVDLGEKEVQIWFQNRRQNDRRKSKPLQPHELIPHFRNGIPVEASSQLPSPQNSQETPTKSGTRAASNINNTVATQASPRQSDLKALLNDSDPPSSSSPAARRTNAEDESPVLSTPPSSFESPTQQPPRASTNTAPVAVPAQRQLPKKRSHEQMMDKDQSVPPSDDSPSDAKSLRRTSSFVRLAVSADGSVKVRVNNETTPSPPKRRPLPPPNVSSRRTSSFSRAHSDLGSSFSFKDANPALKGFLGRSRDARTWEFYCDRSARSSLAARAEEEATGSAIGALGLMRSANQKPKSVLSSSPAKQNRMRRAHSKLKAKPSMSRTQSSMARLQSSDGAYDNLDLTPKKSSHVRHSSGGDSDKENWLPGTRDSVHNLRRIQAAATGGPILQESGVAAAAAARASHAHPIATGPGDQENRPVGQVKDKGDDLDCVQGLLSLSQGAWR